MTLTVRSSSLTGATTAARALTHAEMDANWAHVIESSNQNFTPSGSGAVTRTTQAKMRDWVSVKDFGAEGDGSTDDASAIQACIDAVGSGGHVYFPVGTYMIGTPINLKTQRHLRGSMNGSVIKALSTWNPSIPSITASTYSPTLSFAPLLYNASSIDWWSIDGLTLYGNDEDCYGLWLAENYHGSIKNVLIERTNKRPYTNIRGQAVTHIAFNCYDCDDGVVTYDNTAFHFIGCGFERLGGDWSFDQRQPNSFAKGGVTLDDCWFESASGAAPAEGFLRMSGRRNRINCHFNFHDTATTERLLELNDNTTSRSVDGLTMEAQACARGNFEVNNSSGAMLITAATNTSGNRITGTFTVSKVTDNGTANTWDLNGSLATPVQHVTGRFQVRYGSLSLTAANYVMDADYNAAAPEIRLLGNANNKIHLNSGALRISSNTGMSVSPGSGGFTVLGAGQGATGYEKPLYLGGYALWVDSTGDLRIKSGAPTSDTDGTVVGAQS
jgi:hypothetical protein